MGCSDLRNTLFVAGLGKNLNFVFSTDDTFKEPEHVVPVFIILLPTQLEELPFKVKPLRVPL